ncbi:MAG TPA: methylmalonyl Co-A mutase-associated GTPase MeaB [Nitrososphaerales archaeon]|nr:methylmalonyl Co-A mutase-associated GTPase MeaB [Nitrososphaerales archaeon]
METRKLLSQVATGDRRALAKAITVIEGDPDNASRVLAALRPPGRVFVLGVTGPPGTGKSTLVDRLIGLYRKKGLRVGVIAVDPSSPITGGALLGDRIRMTDHAGDDGVYIRSMASRGWSGGLSRATSQVIQLMDSAGYDVVLIETVGIGQSDMEVVGVSHAVIVLLMPGMGDDIQMSKAGLMEIGDLYVVNKGDLEGADLMVVSLLSLVRTLKSRSPAVVKVSALTGDGLDKLDEAIEAIRSGFSRGDKEIRLRNIKGMIIEMAKGNMVESFMRRSAPRADELAGRVLAGKLTVAEAAARLEP